MLTQYDLDKNGPCFPFYKQQSSQNEDKISYGETNEIDGGEKLKPFLFVRNRKRDSDGFIDFSYDLWNVSELILRFDLLLNCLSFIYTE